MNRCFGALGVVALVSGGPAFGAMVVNGSMNGGVGAGIAPTSWTVAQATPDVVNANGPFNNTGVPWAASPDGGTFARMNGVGDNRSEAISQIVNGFTPGEMYTLSYSITNIGFNSVGGNVWSGFDGFFRFLVNGAEVATSSIVSKPANATDPIVWITESRQFIAPAASFTLTLYAETTADIEDIAYMGLDGVDAAPVPAPAAFAPIAMAALAGARRRRAR